MVRLGGKHIAVEGVGYPELRQDPVVGAGFVRFTQTAGGRAGIHPDFPKTVDRRSSP
jgi:hypothetical protein